MGGGQTTALEFLESLERIDTTNMDFYFAVAKNSNIHKFLTKKGLSNKLIIMPNNPFYRIVKEYLFSKYKLKKFKIDIIYTYFGVGIFPKSIPQVSGQGDANLFFPELDFWSEYKGWKKSWHEFIDRYRIWGLKRMNGLIFDSEAMQKRCEELFQIRETVLVKVSISKDFQSVPYSMPSKIKSRKYKGLFLCSWQRNKNFMIIPRLAAELKKANVDFHFVFTAPIDNSAEHLSFLRQVEKYDVSDRVTVVGTALKTELASLFDQIDFVFLLSKLEAFGNNIIEAWHFKKPLIIADELWSRSICKDAAVYVSRDDEFDIATKLVRVIEDKAIVPELIAKGTKMLSEYPTIEERTQQEIDYIKYIYKNG